MSPLCGCRGEGSERGQCHPGLWSCVQEEAVSQHSLCCQSLQFLPICHWCPSSCCPSVKAQREWICVSSKSAEGPLGSLLRIPQFLLLPEPSLVFIVRSYKDLSSWHWNSRLSGLLWGWDPSLLRYPSRFVSTTCGCGPFHVSASPVCMNMTSLILWLLDFHTTWFYDDPGWYLLSSLVVIFAVVVQGGKLCLLTPPSWPEICVLVLINLKVFSNFPCDVFCNSLVVKGYIILEI